MINYYPLVRYVFSIFLNSFVPYTFEWLYSQCRTGSHTKVLSKQVVLDETSSVFYPVDGSQRKVPALLVMSMLWLMFLDIRLLPVCASSVITWHFSSKAKSVITCDCKMNETMITI